MTMRGAAPAYQFLVLGIRVGRRAGDAGAAAPAMPVESLSEI